MLGLPVSVLRHCAAVAAPRGSSAVLRTSDVRSVSSLTMPNAGAALPLTSREVGHRVKGISVSNFSEEEVQTLTKIGNKIARKIWYGRGIAHTRQVHRAGALLTRAPHLFSGWLRGTRVTAALSSRARARQTT